MRNRKPSPFLVMLGVFLLCAAGARAGASNPAGRDEEKPVDPNDPTYRLFQLLDTTYGGKLEDFYALADLYKDSKDPSEEYRHVLRVQYDQKLQFGKFRIYVRSVGRMTPEQRATYTPAQVYDFGVVDEEKFEKIEPGPFGQPGDVYFRAEPNRPLHSAPTTDAVREAYKDYVTKYILPALQKETTQP
ncbi:MAG: hypothetical protein ACE145_03650 [Terriglobia bacterium]